MGHCSRSTWDLFILFGSNRMDELKTLALKNKEKGLDSGYNVLIGLSRIEGSKSDFEDIAVDYAVQFGQSPPSWLEEHTTKKVTNAPSLEVSISNFSADTIIETTVKMESPRLLVLNMANVQKVDASGVDLFNEALNARIDRGEKTKVINSEALVDKLIDRLKAVPGQPPLDLWNFCLTVFKLTNAKEKFDSAIIQFKNVGGTEIEWKNLADPEEVVEVMKKSPNLMSNTKISTMTVDWVKNYLATPVGAEARSKGEIIIDMSGTQSGSLTDLIGILPAIQYIKDQKLKVLMINVNEIFYAMFNALAINQIVESITLPGMNN